MQEWTLVLAVYTKDYPIFPLGNIQDPQENIVLQATLLRVLFPKVYKQLSAQLGKIAHTCTPSPEAGPARGSRTHGQTEQHETLSKKK